MLTTDQPDLRLEITFKKFLPRIRLQTGRKLAKKFAAKYGFHSDGLAVWGKSVDFLKDPRFMNAYQLGMNSGHKIGRQKGSSTDIHIEWRVLVCCWAAQHARQIEGDYVECGVNTGILSLAACDYSDFNSSGKTFFLFDTFCGIPEQQAMNEEMGHVRFANKEMYEDCFEVAKNNFSRFPKAVLVRGRVPETLTSVEIKKVCYLSIDMNIVQPEIAAAEFFWDKLSPGAPIILDDYGFSGYEKQKEAFDQFAKERRVEILTLPTGQGLLMKPPKSS